MKILNRYTNACLWEGEATNTRESVEKAVASRADLTRADLRGADLTRADLRGADLRGADLRGADLTDADLTRADLRDADLTRADLRGDKLKSAGDTASRSDGYEFRAFVLTDGTLKIKAGCRWFTSVEAREHWMTTRGGTRLGEESLAIVEHLERMHAIVERYAAVTA